MKYQYQIGADPELFLVGKDGAFKSAHNVIKGTKEDPFPVLCGFIQVDGVAAEFNVNPAYDAETFSDNIKSILMELQERVEAKNKGLSLIVSPTATFTKGYFRNLPKKAKLLGCEPDFNVYSEAQNPPPETKKPFRTGAGHIHVGWTTGENPNDHSHKFDCQEAVKQLDAVLYPMSLLWDDDETRRTLYGQIGSYRPKHYGVEYRPLSNAWVADPDLHLWIFNASVHVMEVLDGNDTKIYHDYFQQDLLKRIRNEEKVSRLALLEYHDYLTEEYLVPELPEAYTRTYQ